MKSREPHTRKFKITGMDCASCAQKIERAVGRIPGASSVKVGVTSETLTVTLAEPDRAADVTQAVESLGYGIGDAGTSSGARAGARDDQEHGDHQDHAKPIEGTWWQSSKGQIVIISGG